jgi:hypothetical protein
VILVAFFMDRVDKNEVWNIGPDLEHTTKSRETIPLMTFSYLLYSIFWNSRHISQSIRNYWSCQGFGAKDFLFLPTLLYCIVSQKKCLKSCTLLYRNVLHCKPTDDCLCGTQWQTHHIGTIPALRHIWAHRVSKLDMNWMTITDPAIILNPSVAWQQCFLNTDIYLRRSLAQVLHTVYILFTSEQCENI